MPGWARRNVALVRGVARYTSAFWSSDCCGAPFWRFIEMGVPDRFECRACGRACQPVRSG